VHCLQLLKMSTYTIQSVRRDGHITILVANGVVSIGLAFILTEGTAEMHKQISALCRMSMVISKASAGEILIRAKEIAIETNPYFST
jgi:hypothetical protein